MSKPAVLDCLPMLKALADETRWRIVQELLAAPLTVTEITTRLKGTQYNTSKHLKVLREAGIIESARQGKHVYCQVVPAFRCRLSRTKSQLDLGCCTFRFDKVPK